MPDLNTFRDAAKQMGYQDSEIEAFLATVPEKPAGLTPSFSEGFTPGANFEQLAQEQGYAQEEIKPFGEALGQAQEATPGAMLQGVRVEGLPPINQAFGNRSGVEVFSGGVNRGVDFGVKPMTQLSAPEGNWQVVEAFGGANPFGGYIGNQANRGYGNSVLLQNQKTGEMLRLSHLSQVGVKPGQTVKGGQAIALSGSSGNSTGSHLDIEYIDVGGRLRDVSRTSYAQQIFM